jgi:hypothetical protein
MARMTKREADEFRKRIALISAEPNGWRDYEDRRYWLRKLLKREENYYTQAERKAVDRIAFARTPFEGWGGYSVQELYRVALPALAVVDEGYEPLMEEIAATNPTRLVRDDMKALVGLCILAGMDLPRFPSRAQEYDYDDETERAN